MSIVVSSATIASTVILEYHDLRQVLAGGAIGAAFLYLWMATGVKFLEGLDVDLVSCSCVVDWEILDKGFLRIPSKALRRYLQRSG